MTKDDVKNIEFEEFKKLMEASHHVSYLLNSYNTAASKGMTVADCIAMSEVIDDAVKKVQSRRKRYLEIVKLVNEYDKAN